MKYSVLDLNPYYNHKIIQETSEQETKEDFETDNLYILKSNILFKECEVKGAVNQEFSFSRYDNIKCENQRIAVNAIANKLCLVGFACWGDSDGLVKILYDDFSEEYHNINFLECVRKAREDYDGDKAKTILSVVRESGLCGSIHFHQHILALPNRKYIKEITLPNNGFVHIFFITIEDTQN